MNDHFGNRVLENLFQYSDDGFIVVDEKGIVQDINEQYASYFAKDRSEIIGHPIEETISTTSMYDVMEKGLIDSREDVYLQSYVGDDLNQASGLHQAQEIRIPALRFCVYDEDRNLLGAAAQMKFPDRAEEISRKYKEAELDYYKESYQDNVFAKSGFENMLGKDPKMIRVKQMGMRAARSDFPVLITGETGTGKEVMAKSIHLAGSRKDKPFVAINCGAIPENLLESELFGYEGGAFTGARRGGKPGKFEQANGGTIFLDEIGDMPLHMQVKLLRVLQEGEIDRVGGSSPIPVDVRVLSATRRNLPEMMAEGTFREDLFYRLAVVNIQTVPLRDCPGDILQHAYHHLDRLNRQYRTQIMLSESAKHCLLLHPWPGNIRELQNVLSSAYAMCDGDLIEPENLPQRIARLTPDAGIGTAGAMWITGTAVTRGAAGAAGSAGTGQISNQADGRNQGTARGSSRAHGAASGISYGSSSSRGLVSPDSALSLKEKVRRYEMALIREALDSCNGSMAEAARRLQVERSLLYKKMEKFGMK